MTQAADDETERFFRKQDKYRGCAKIAIKDLVFERRPDASFFDEKNVERLIEVFKLEGCLRANYENHVPCLISDFHLERALQTAKLGLDDLEPGDPPHLKFTDDLKLSCLHGKHRIEAAKRFLGPGDRWWVVELYEESLDLTIQKDVEEEYANSRNFCDGDIFRYLRHCQLTQDERGENRWLARLSSSKRKDVTQLLKRKELRPLVKAFDELLVFKGLWPALQIGIFHRILNLKCPEELGHYLIHIRNCWDAIVGGNDDPSLRNKVDFQTSSYLLEDTKWLEPCVKVLRLIFDVKSGNSMKKTILFSYDGDGEVLLLRGSDFEREQGTEVEASVFGYHQLWLLAWRHFPELSNMSPRLDDGTSLPLSALLSEQYLWWLAAVAKALGFNSKKIETIVERDPDRKVVQDFIHSARPATIYDFEDYDQEALIKQILQLIQTVPKRGTPNQAIDSESIVPLRHRCGRPYIASHRFVKCNFFIQDVYKHNVDRLDEFAVQIDIYQRFFGREALKPAIMQSTATKRPAPEAAKRGGSNRPTQQQDSNGNDTAMSNTGSNTNPAPVNVDQLESLYTGSQPLVIGTANINPDQVTEATPIFREWYEHYESHCHDGWLWFVHSYENSVMTFEASDAQCFQEFIGIGNAGQYAVDWDVKTSQLMCFPLQEYQDHARGPNKDGVVFIFYYETDAAANQGQRYIKDASHIRGATTEERICNLQRFAYMRDPTSETYYHEASDTKMVDRDDEI